MLFSVTVYCQQGQWTWMNGDSTIGQSGVYGTKGVFAPGNTPPSLYEPCEWTDKQGNFWLFGGMQLNGGTFVYGDLWEFNPIINQWAWINGPGVSGENGVYGTQGVASPTNIP